MRLVTLMINIIEIDYVDIGEIALSQKLSLEYLEELDIRLNDSNVVSGPISP